MRHVASPATWTVVPRIHNKPEVIDMHTLSTTWTLTRGATVENDGVRFSVWAPKAKSLSVRLITNGREKDHELESHGAGVFEGFIRGAKAGDDYRYVIDGDQALPDPVSRFQPEGVHGPSRVVDPATFQWTDDDWQAPAMADYVIYELHVGTFTKDRTFLGIEAHLAELRELGVTAIEIMPVAQFPGERNWGYDGVLPYAVQNSYGGPEALRHLVNAAHAAGLCVILDVVYNHLGPEGNYLGAYGPYFTETYRTPWGQAVNYDGRDSDEVRRYIIDNALHWITEYHIDGLRLDAVHGIYDMGASHVLKDLTDAVHAQAAALGRTVQLIAESDLNDPRMVRASDEDGHGFDAQWADDLHHAVHSVLTGETGGYYADFGGLEPVAKALEHPFVYAGRYSAHRRRRHGAPAAGISADHFIVCIQNHDQVGNRAAGERLSVLTDAAGLRLGAALYLLSPYVPMLWMGEEYGEPNPFQYFVSHGDEKLLGLVREGRRKEFESFGWGNDVPDPGAVETFERSTLDRSARSKPGHRELYALYRELLRVRREEPALRPGGAEPHVEYNAEQGWITLELAASGSEGADLMVLFNLAKTEVDVPVAPPKAGSWEHLLSTEDSDFGGKGSVPKTSNADGRNPGRLRLPARSAVLYRRRLT